MIPNNLEMAQERRMSSLAILDTRLRQHKEDSAILLRGFFEEAMLAGATDREAALMLMGGMAEIALELARMIDEDNPHAPLHELRSLYLEPVDEAG